jgi:Ca2+-transporting ATPase
MRPILRDGEGLDPGAQPLLRRALEIGVLCNDASLEEGAAASGDPLEVALLAAGLAAGIARSRLVADAPELLEVAFDPAVQMMATVHRAPEGCRAAVEGAPESVLARCTRFAAPDGDRPLDGATRADFEARNEAMARRGLRVLAVADRALAAPPREVYEDLVLVGLVGLLDPPRADVRDAIRACRDAGIRVVMVTGDQAATARTIAHAVGLIDDADARVVLGAELAKADARDLDAAIFARVSPSRSSR